MTFATPKLFRSLSPAIIKINIEQPIIFVEPSLFDLEPTDDPILSGSLSLTLSRPRAVQSLVVTLEGFTSLFACGGFSSDQSLTLSKKIELVLDGEILSAGTHSFTFSFIIPSDTSPSMRSVYGCTDHFVTGSVTFVDKVKKHGKPSQVWIIQNTIDQNAESTFHQNVQRTTDFLGPITATLSSPHLSANSLLKVDISITSPPENVTIISIDSSITQAFAMLFRCGTSHNPPSQTYHLDLINEFTSSPDVSSSSASTYSAASSAGTTSSSLSSQFSKLFVTPPHLDFSLSKPILGELSANNESSSWNYSSTLQLPNEEIIRPSTLSNTNSRIKINHKLSISIRYRVAGLVGEKLLTISKKVNIPSCKCLTGTIILPVYVAQAPSSFSNLPISPLRGDRKCQCYESSILTLDLDQEVTSIPMWETVSSLYRGDTKNGRSVRSGRGRLDSSQAENDSAWLALAACSFA